MAVGQVQNVCKQDKRTDLACMNICEMHISFLVCWKLNNNLGLVSNDCVTSRGLHRIEQPYDTGRLVALLNMKDENC